LKFRESNSKYTSLGSLGSASVGETERKSENRRNLQILTRAFRDKKWITFPLCGSFYAFLLRFLPTWDPSSEFLNSTETDKSRRWV